jgi:hypothetical protein
MSTRRFFLFAVLTAVIAIVLHVAALSQISRSVQHRARAVTLSEAQRAAVRVEAGVYSTHGLVAMYAGLAFALGSIALVTISARKREPARRSVVLGLLLCYLLLLFVLV